MSPAARLGGFGSVCLCAVFALSVCFAGRLRACVPCGVVLLCLCPPSTKPQTPQQNLKLLLPRNNNNHKRLCDTKRIADAVKRGEGALRDIEEQLAFFNEYLYKVGLRV